MMNQVEVTEKLKKEAQNDPVADAVLHVFAMRKRARRNVTINGLLLRMKNEGFNYDRAEYSRVLKMLASLGLGQLDTDSAGRVRALKDIKQTLQSIGAVAVGEKGGLKPTKLRHRYVRLVSTDRRAPLPVEKPKRRPSLNPMSLEVNVNGKPIKVSIPNEITQEELSMFLEKLMR